MKLINVIFFLVLLTGCSKKKDSFENFRSLTAGNTAPNAIVISCIRCGCIIEEINHILKDKPQAFKDYAFYADTTCTGKFIIPVGLHHVPQSSMDSISMDFYNLLIVKGANKKVKMLKTEESNHLLQFIQ